MNKVAIDDPAYIQLINKKLYDWMNSEDSASECEFFVSAVL